MYFAKTAAASAITAIALTLTPTVGPSSSVDMSVAAPAVKQQLSRAQWQEIAHRAQLAGDLDAARAARAAGMARTTTSQGTSQFVIGTVAKKAIKAALKYGRQYLPSSVRKYADLLYDKIDWLDTTSQAATAAGLIQLGVEPTIAREISTWIWTFA